MIATIVVNVSTVVTRVVNLLQIVFTVYSVAGYLIVFVVCANKLYLKI